jgi:hypothetical protein
MSLFDSASLVVTPNGVKAGKLYNIKPTDGSGDLSVTRATSATRVNANGLIETVGANVPRLDYSNGSCPSILVEPQRTNLALNSEQFDNASWVKERITVSANATTAPDGTLTADKVIENTDNNSHRIRQNLSSTSGLSYSLSSYIKAAGRTKARVFVGGINAYCDFDLTSGTIIGSPVNCTASIQNVGDGWYRCSISYLQTTTSGAQLHLFAPLDSSGNFSYTGNGVDGIFVWGAQLEAGSNATSYIPTVASAVTRNADVISKTGISDLINSREGVLFANIKAISNPASTNSGISLGFGANRICFRFSTVANRINVIVVKDTVIQVNSSYNLFNNYATEFNKIALKYKDNDVSLYINGVKVLEKLTCIMPDANSIFSLLFADGTSELPSFNTFFGDVNLVSVFPIALSDAELIQLTTL